MEGWVFFTRKGKEEFFSVWEEVKLSWVAWGEIDRQREEIGE
jgi:hypothetical protein